MEKNALFCNATTGILAGILSIFVIAGCGGSSGSATPPVAVMSLLAGNVGGSGSVDGAGSSARFKDPVGVAVDSANNTYIADTGNHIIRKISAAGEVTTLAGTPSLFGGYAEGVGEAAGFYSPEGVAVDGSGNVYVADTGNHVIRKISPAGVTSLFAGAPRTSGNADGAGTAARFSFPLGVAVDGAGNVYVADTDNFAIRKISPAGEVTTLAVITGRPYGVAVDSVGNVYVADYGHNAILKISGGTVTTLASGVSYPYGIAVDNSGNVFAACDFGRVIRKISAAGTVSIWAGQAGVYGSADGSGSAATFYFPRGVAADNAGNIYVADDFNHVIRKVTSTGLVTTLAGAGSVTGAGDGDGIAASFNSPMGLDTDGSGNIYVADSNNHTIRKISPAGGVSTFAGTAGVSGSADGTGGAARFNQPYGLTVDVAGNIFVSDSGNNTIRKITPAGEVSTLAGVAGVWGSADGTGNVASFNFPTGITSDQSGNIYVADTYNRTVRKISSSGVVQTLAGTAGASGNTDALGAAARFSRPIGMAADAEGNVYVTDTDNYSIRKITPAGLVSSVSGTAGMVGIVLDDAKNIYVANNNGAIHKVSQAGTISTVVGSVSQAGYITRTGFTSGNLPGAISSPRFLTLSGRTLYFTMNNGVVKVTDLP